MNEQLSEYMIQVKATCTQFKTCTMKNVITCRRCLKQQETQKIMFGDLLGGLGLNQKEQDSFMKLTIGLTQSLLSPRIKTTNYWCFKCNRYHRLTSHIGKAHSTIKENQI